MSDTIRVVCRHCGAKINAPATKAGKVVSCPRCHGKVEIVSDDEQADDGYALLTPTPPPSAIVAEPPTYFSAVRTPECDEEFDEPPLDDDDDTEPDRPMPESPLGAIAKSFQLHIGAASANERFPHLSMYLLVIQFGLAVIAALFIVFSLLLAPVTFISAFQWDVVSRIGFTLIQISLISFVGWMIYMLGMAGVELVRVLLQIEINTRR